VEEKVKIAGTSEGGRAPREMEMTLHLGTQGERKGALAERVEQVGGKDNAGKKVE